ncbi:TetR/AcrR family transcriptional regulator [Solirubrobacter soli]|uniref:TetR/AcrR family transcriptional regulator n=1 Tax=Solirubrobacter soli TaxID=363832 RepID=UPI000411062B|nr:TetR/AcrR family transcriptional regulator [Solirubrobacter soli]
MPRISADTVAEHVAQQESAVFDAAIRLFLERGYAAVGLGDIAAAVGLKRTSLYRYFPDKAHILARWLRRELDAEAATSAELLAGNGDIGSRIERWVDHQLAYARRPEHALVRAAPEAERALDDETRAGLADGHRRLLAPLSDLLRASGLSDTEVAATTTLLFGLVRAAVDAEPSPALHQQLSAAIGGLLAAVR